MLHTIDRQFPIHSDGPADIRKVVDRLPPIKESSIRRLTICIRGRGEVALDASLAAFLFRSGCGIV